MGSACWAVQVDRGIDELPVEVEDGVASYGMVRWAWLGGSEVGRKREGAGSRLEELQVHLARSLKSVFAWVLFCLYWFSMPTRFDYFVGHNSDFFWVACVGRPLRTLISIHNEI